EVDITEEAQPLQLYALAQNADDNELLNMYYKRNAKTPEQLRAKAKKMRLIGWIGGGVLAVGGIITGIVLHYRTEWDLEKHEKVRANVNWETWVPIGGGVVTGAAIAIGCNLYANSLQKKALELSTYSSPLIEGDIMNFGKNKLTAGVSVMGNQYTHTSGLGMSFKLNF
ncbi:MAG: hypothetical protein K2M01_05165, partial [Paramuribaculum sp.]|nr:hypothetical protein [Paramuribaculum sp.]